MASIPRNAPPTAGVLERWARFSYRNRWRVIGVWVVCLAGVIAANFMFSGEYSSEFKVPGSESQKANNLLEAHFPARAGDSADLVFEAPAGVTGADARRRIEAVIEQVAQIDGVVSVDSPYDDPRYISKDGTIARSDVNWATQSGDVNSASLDQFLNDRR